MSRPRPHEVFARALSKVTALRPDHPLSEQEFYDIAVKALSEFIKTPEFHAIAQETQATVIQELIESVGSGERYISIAKLFEGIEDVLMKTDEALRKGCRADEVALAIIAPHQERINSNAGQEVDPGYIVRMMQHVINSTQS